MLQQLKSMSSFVNIIQQPTMPQSKIKIKYKTPSAYYNEWYEYNNLSIKGKYLFLKSDNISGSTTTVIPLRDIISYSTS